MEILKIVGLALSAAVLCLLLRQTRPEMAVLVALAAGVALFFVVIARVGGVIDALEKLSQRAGLHSQTMEAVVRVIGVAFIAELGAQACRDAGEGALALKVELGGRVVMLAMAVPLLITVMDSLFALMP